MTTTGATAAELSQCETISLYGSFPHGGGSPALMSTSTFGPTGVRLYPYGVPTDTNQYAWQGPAGGGFNMAPSNSGDGGGTGVSVYTSGTNTLSPVGTGQSTSSVGVSNYFNNGTTSGDGSGSCQVTIKGTILDLYNQILQMQKVNAAIEGGSASSAATGIAAAKAFLDQRMLEIYPGATQANLDNITGTIPPANQTGPSSTGLQIDTGKYFIYYKDQSAGGSPYTSPAGGSGLTISTTPPTFWLNYSGATATGVTANQKSDGNHHVLTGQYACLNGVTDPFFCYGIHDRLFETSGTDAAGEDNLAEITAFQAATFRPGSGAYGNLGTISFTEYIAPGGYQAGYIGGPPTPTPPTTPPTFNNRD